MKDYTIPPVEEAVEDLKGFGRLISATRWKRAAIIVSLVGPPVGSGGWQQSSHVNFAYSPTSLAELGLHGLSSRTTIGHYQKQWWNQYGVVPEEGYVVTVEQQAVEWTGTNTAYLKQQRTEREATEKREREAAEAAAEEHDPDEVDTEAAAVRQARIDGTLRLVRDGPEEEQQEPYVTPKIQAGDLADTVMHRVVCANARDVERAFEEDYPTIKEYRWRREQWQGDLTELAGIVQRLIDRTAEFSTEQKEGNA